MACLCHLGIELRHQAAGLLLFFKDATQGQHMVFDHFKMAFFAVLEVHVVMQRGGNLAQLLVMVGLQRGNQNQVGVQRMHALQIGLDDGAQVLDLAVVFVLA